MSKTYFLRQPCAHLSYGSVRCKQFGGTKDVSPEKLLCDKISLYKSSVAVDILYFTLIQSSRKDLIKYVNNA